MIKSIVSALAAFSLAHAGLAFGGDVYRLDEQGEARFQAVGNPGFIRINGEGGKPRGEIELESPGKLLRADVKVKLSDLTTGIDRRDEHMRDKYLEVGRFPEAELVVVDVTAHSGKLTLHGVTKTVPIEVSNLTSSPDVVSGDVAFEVVLKDFAVAIPSFIGVTVADSVKVTAKFHAVRAKK